MDDSSLARRITELVESATDAKDELAKLAQSDPLAVRTALKRLCTEQYLMHKACKAGQEDVVAFLTGYCPDINVASPQLGTALSIACQYGFECIVDVLLCGGATVPPPSWDPILDKGPESTAIHCPFYRAVCQGWANILQMLVEAKPDNFRAQSSCERLLHCACRTGHVSVLRYCLAALPRLCDTPESLQEYISKDMLRVCLQYEQICLIPCLLIRKAWITESLITDYSAVIGRFLEKFTVESGDETKSLTSKADVMALDWSNKNLAACDEQWLESFVDVLHELTLSHNPLTALPPFIPWMLPALQTFLCANCDLRSIATAPQLSCNNLHTVDLSHNVLHRVPCSLFHLPTLQSLNLSYNRIGSLTDYSKLEDDALSPVDSDLASKPWTCVQLETLNVSNNSLTTLPPQLHACTRLQRLSVEGNRLLAFIRPWPCPLSHMDLSRNRLIGLPLGLDDTWSPTLTSLNLSHNLLLTIPQTICRLEALRELRLSHNRLTLLPNPHWWRCSGLQILNLSGNQLGANSQRQTSRSLRILISEKLHSPKSSRSASPTSEAGRERNLVTSDVMGGDELIALPKIFAQSLYKLNLSSNQLTSVPPSVCDLTELSILNLSRNPFLKELPNQLCQLKHLEILDLEEVKLSDKGLAKLAQKTSMNGYSTREILAYLKHKYRQCVPHHRLQLLIVGSQDRGKTALAHAVSFNAAPTRNVATHGVVIKEWNMSSSKSLFALTRPPDLTLQIWDFAGQRDYYVTHKVFLSPSALYLVVFDLRLQRQGVDALHPWLADIQAHARNSHVIVVGTFLDQLKERRDQLPALRDYIFNKYSHELGYPIIDGVVEVCSVGKREGIDKLHQLIQESALLIKVPSGQPHRTESLVGRMVPRDYLALRDAVKRKAAEVEKSGAWPVLGEQEFWALITSVSDTNITNSEELRLATRFLHESGHLLHFSTQLHGLADLFFINPQWLADTLARFFAVNAVHKFAHGGIMNLPDARALLFRDISDVDFDQFIDLLESFDIALRLDHRSLLLPSRLPTERPCFRHSMPADREKTRRGEGRAQKKCGAGGVAERTLNRLYRLKHVPSGLWSRLIVQLLASVLDLGNLGGSAERLARGGSRRGRRASCRLLQTARGRAQPAVTYWQEGVIIDRGTSLLFVESAATFFPLEPSGAGVESYGGGGEEGGERYRGVLVTAIGSEDDDSSLNVLFAFATDLVYSLIDQWFPGLLDEGAMEQIIPCPVCLSARPDPNMLTDLHWFSLIECSSLIISAATTKDLALSCRRCGTHRVSLEELVPDLLLLDVGPRATWAELGVDKEAGLLGRGGEGSVYKGTFNGHEVAVKQHIVIDEFNRTNRAMNPSSPYTHAQDSGCPTDPIGQEVDQTVITVQGEGSEGDPSSPRGVSSSAEHSDSSGTESTSWSEIDHFWKYRTLKAFHNFRAEVCALSTLTHPCIVSLLAVCPSHLAYVMDLCPRGSLRRVLSALAGEQTTGAPQRASALRQGIPLGRFLTYKVVCQITSALHYLHSMNLVYKDMKPDNLLVWSLDPLDPVNVKLSDYGLACRMTQQGLMGLEGTPGYLAPEIRQHKPYNEKVDIFALAMVMYELGSGRNCFPGLPSVAVSKLIQDGKRPLFDFADDTFGGFPQLVSLIRRCWAHDPVCRPSASEMIDLLKDASFLAMEKVVDLEGQGILGSVTTACWSEAVGSSHNYIRLWTGIDKDRRYHIFNPNVGQFKVLNQSPRSPKECVPIDIKSKVTCMAVIGQLLVIGTTDHNLEVFKKDRKKAEYVILASDQSLLDVPLFMLPCQTTSASEEAGGNILVGLANSQLRLYRLWDRVGGDGSGEGRQSGASRGSGEERRSGSEYMELHASIFLKDHPLGLSRAATCAVFVKTFADTSSSKLQTGPSFKIPNPNSSMPGNNSLDRINQSAHSSAPGKSFPPKGHGLQGRELWIGCGCDVVIVEYDADMRLTAPRETLRAFSGHLTVRAICCHDDQVWCLSRHGSLVAEFDVESRQLFCIFDCSGTNPLDSVVRRDPIFTDGIESGEGEAVEGSKGVAEAASVHKPHSLRTLMRKRLIKSMRKAPELTLPSDVTLRVVRGRSQKAPACPPGAAEGGEEKGRQEGEFGKQPAETEKKEGIANGSPVVRAVCYGGGTLWVGRSSGDILVISVSTSSESSVEHGRVIAVLHHDSILCDEGLSSDNGTKTDTLCKNYTGVLAYTTQRDFKPKRTDSRIDALISVSDKRVVAVCSHSVVEPVSESTDGGAVLRKKESTVGKAATKKQVPTTEAELKKQESTGLVEGRRGSSLVLWAAMGVSEILQQREAWSVLEGGVGTQNWSGGAGNESEGRGRAEGSAEAGNRLEGEALQTSF